MKLLDDFIRAVLAHIFNSESIPIDFLTKELLLIRIQQLAEILGLTEETFLQKGSFDSQEKIAVIIHLLNEGYSPYHLFKFLNWKDFEALVGTLLERRQFFVEKNFRFKNEDRWNEIDVMAFQYPHLLLIDCKFHKKDSLSHLKNAAMKQKERALYLLESFPTVSEYLIKRLAIPMKQIIYIIPLVISWYEIESKLAEGIPIVPFRALNGFIAEVDELKDSLFYLKMQLN